MKVELKEGVIKKHDLKDCKARNSFKTGRKKIKIQQVDFKNCPINSLS